MAGTALWPAGIAALAGLGGSATGLVGIWLNGRSAERMEGRRIEAERVRREHEAAISVREDRRRFQHETLVALQDAVNDSARAATRIAYEDEVAYRTGASPIYGKQSVGEELSVTAFQANRSVASLRVRVRDDRVRMLVAEFQTCTNRATSVHDRDEADEACGAFTALANAINERIGELLRELDAD